MNLESCDSELPVPPGEDIAAGVPCRHWAPGLRSSLMEDRIIIDPTVCNGRPTVRGTRITAQSVLEFLGAGDSIEEILEEYPILTRDDVLACLRYSSRLMGNHFVVEKVA